MSAGQIVTRLAVREDENGKTFLEACHKIQPCGCEIVGSGTLQDLLDIKYCPSHASVKTEDDILLYHLRNGSNWVKTFRHLQEIAKPEGAG